MRTSCTADGEPLSALAWRFREPAREGLVSVIIPTHDRRSYILDAVESVRAQTWRPIELIVVDDGSTDGTLELLRRWAADLPDDEGLTVRLERQERSGAPRARNRGILLATGQFVQFLDADDTLAPTKLALQVAHLEAHPALDMSIGQTCSMTEPERSLHAHREYVGIDLLCRSASWSPFSTLGPLVRRKVLGDPATAWDERLTCCQDWEHFTRLIQLGIRYGYQLDARAYIRPPDGRSRAGTHDRHDLRPAYLAARRIQLRSMWCHADIPTRRSGAFRLALAWELLRLHARLVQAGLHDAAPQVLAWADEAARGTVLAPLTSRLRTVDRQQGPVAAARIFTAVAWIWYRVAGVRGRIGRRASLARR